MGITVSEMADVAARYGNESVEEQADDEAPWLERLGKLDKPAEIGIVNIKAGGLDSTKNVADGGTLPRPSQKTIARGTYLPKGTYNALEIPRIAARTVTSNKDGVDLVLEQLETAAADYLRQLCRSLISSSLGSPAAAVAAGDTSFTIVGPEGMRNGMSVDVYNGSTYVETVTLGNITIPANAASAATVVTSAAANAWTTSYTFWLQGSYDNGLNSLADVTAAASLYGQAHTANEWNGNLLSSVGTLSITGTTGMRALSRVVKKRRSRKWDYLLMDSTNLERYSNLNINQRRFVPGQQMDAVGSDELLSEFEGRPIVIDENVSSGDVFFITKKDIIRHQFIPYGPEVDGGERPSARGLGAAIISSDKLSYVIQMWGASNLRCMRRNGIGRMTGITG